MKRVGTWSAVLLAIGAMLVAGRPCLAAPPRAAIRVPSDDLLGAVAPSRARPPEKIASDSHAKRSRAVSLNTDAVTKLATSLRPTVRFNLFDNATFTGIATTVETRSADSFTCTGKLISPSNAQPPNDDGDFVVAVQDGTLVANFWSHTRGTFQIRPAKDGTYRAQELDPQQFGGCAIGPQHLIKTNQPGGDDRNKSNLIPDPCTQLIDVMVLYTPAARVATGSTSAIKALAYASVASSNIAYENSAINARLRLVHVAQTEYIESGDITTDLARITIENDGYMDEVAAMRDAAHADMVSLLEGFVSNGSCGVGFVMYTPSQVFQAFAFTVVQQDCAVGNLSFAHELGHNLGCNHDHSDPSKGMFPYSHGLRFTGLSGEQWRTVMALSPGNRVPYFSNPNVLFDGVPTGIPEGAADAADNARTINFTAPVAAAFRAMGTDDCNHNNIPDGCDIIEGHSLDLNENGVPDECDGPSCPADLVTKLTATDAASFDQLGSRVAMSEERIVVSAEFDDDAGFISGAAYVFRKSGGKGKDATWAQEVKLVASDAAGFQHFGNSVAIAPAGDFVIVGAYRYSAFASDVGQAYVFRRADDFWVLEAKLVNPDPVQADWFGWSVALCVDSSGALHAVVAALLDDEAANDAGALYVYRRDGFTWNLQAKLMANEVRANSWLGYSIAANGDRIIAGALLDDRGGLNSGAAYIFHRDGDRWTEEAKLFAYSPHTNDRFGISVSIRGDRALVGAPGDDEKGDRAGAAHAFKHAGRLWLHERTLFAADAQPAAAFGGSVSLGGGIDGDPAVIGAVLESTSGATSGAAYVFDHSTGNWQQRAKITAPDGASYDNFGGAVSVSPSGEFAAAGALFDDHHGAIDAGSVSVFSLNVSQVDCNGNGQPDDCDIANGVSADRDGDGIPDECKSGKCTADIYAFDGVVNVDDLLVVVTHWGPCPPRCSGGGGPCAGDITQDCAVNELDLNQIIAQWGPCK